jgi:hypothetical protein
MTRLILLSYVNTSIIAHRNVEGKVRFKEHFGPVRAGNVDHRSDVRTLSQGAYIIQLKASQRSESITS